VAETQSWPLTSMECTRTALPLSNYLFCSDIKPELQLIHLMRFELFPNLYQKVMDTNIPVWIQCKNHFKH
jgi:hypothetical protein